MSRVILNELGPFPCELLPDRWNGYVCPLFTLEVGKDIMIEIQEDPEVLEASYVPDLDAFVIRRREEDEPECFDRHQETGLYPIGAFAWVWQQVPDIGCFECSWKGFEVFNEGDDDLPLGEIQRCDTCSTVESDEIAFELARDAGYQIDEEGRVIALPPHHPIAVPTLDDPKSPAQGTAGGADAPPALSPTEWRVFRAVHRYGPADPVTLASRVALPQGHVALLLKRLQTKGAVSSRGDTFSALLTLPTAVRSLLASVAAALADDPEAWEVARDVIKDA